MLGAGRQHDVEHLLGGGGYDMLGEWVPNYMRVGELSGPFVLQKYEDYFDLPIREARERIGMVGVVDRDTTALSVICMEGVLCRSSSAARPYRT